MSTQETPTKGQDGKATVALIAGPTASGKSGLVLELAELLEARQRKAVIINADSMQVYSDIPVLSAAPTDEEIRDVPHRLYGAWDGAQACSAADWAERAKVEIAEAHQAGRVPILVGGTGMYIKILLDGIAPIPEIDADVREEVRGLATEVAYAALQSEDSERAALLEPADSQRIGRALEVVRSTGQPLSYWQEHLEGGIGAEIDLHALTLRPDRDWLYERCDRRFVQMLDQGALAEVEALVERGLDPHLPVMRAIGVREIAAWQKGELSREEAIAAGQQATRNYAKRQFTWFGRQFPQDWIGGVTDSDSLALHFDNLLQY